MEGEDEDSEGSGVAKPHSARGGVVQGASDGEVLRQPPAPILHVSGDERGHQSLPTDVGGSGHSHSSNVDIQRESEMRRTTPFPPLSSTTWLKIVWTTPGTIFLPIIALAMSLVGFLLGFAATYSVYRQGRARARAFQGFVAKVGDATFGGELAPGNGKTTLERAEDRLSKLLYSAKILKGTEDRLARLAREAGVFMSNENIGSTLRDELNKIKLRNALEVKVENSNGADVIGVVPERPRATGRGLTRLLPRGWRRKEAAASETVEMNDFVLCQGLNDSAPLPATSQLHTSGSRLGARGAWKSSTTSLCNSPSGSFRKTGEKPE